MNFEDSPVIADEAEVSPLAYAARAGDLAEVQRLLASDADPNVHDSVGETPLFEAAANGNMSIVVALLLAGADPEWQSFIGGVAADLADEASMAALFRVCCGEAITEEEQDDIIAAVDYSLRQPIYRFLRSLTGEEEADERKRREEEEWLRPTNRAASEDAGGSGGAPSKPRSLALPEEVEVVVTHAIKEGSMTLHMSSASTFGEVKAAIQAELDRHGIPCPNIYLVRKERDTYQAYKDREPIGDVREVRMVGAGMPPNAGGTS